MSFSFHSDLHDHPVFRRLSTDALGLWLRAGIWTSAHRSPGFVPDHAIDEIGDGDDISGAVNELVTGGAWTRTDGGYRMEYGPSTDFPLPIWRYDKESVANGLFEVVPEPDI